MQLAFCTTDVRAVPLPTTSSRRTRNNSDPSIEIAAAFKAACKAAVATQAEVERIAETIPDEWFTPSGIFRMPHAKVSEADRALFDNRDFSFQDDADVDARLPKLAKKYCKDRAMLARLPEIAADLKAKIAAFNAEREPVLEASGLNKAGAEASAAGSARRTASKALVNAVPTTSRGAQAVLSAMMTAVKASEKDGLRILNATEICKITRNVSAFIGGGSR